MSPSEESLVVSCPACATEHEIVVGDAGGNIECECGAVFGVRDRDDLPIIFRVACPDCDAAYDLDADDCDARLDCPCGCSFVVDEDTQSSTTDAVRDGPPNIASGVADAQLESSPRLHDTELTTGGAGQIEIASDLTSTNRSGSVGRHLRQHKSMSKAWLWPTVVVIGVVAMVGVFVASSTKSTKEVSNEDGQQANASPPTKRSRNLAQLIPKTILPAWIRKERSNSSEQAPTNPINQQESTSEPKQSPNLPRTETPSRSLANLPTVKARTALEIPEPKQRFRQFDDALQAAQEQYARSTQPPETEVQAGDESNMEKSNSEQTHVDNRAIAEAVGILRSGMALVDEKTKPEKLLEARHLLAFLLYETGHLHSAAAVGEFIAQFGDPDNLKTQEAAFLALSALTEIYQTTESDIRTAELDHVLRASQLIDERWPAHDRIDDLRWNAAQMCRLHGQSRSAGDWYSKIPRGTSRFAEAQLEAGRAYWAAYRGLAHFAESSEQNEPVPLSTRKDSDEELLQLAQARLESGIQTIHDQQPDSPPDLLFVAKLDLAQLHLEQHSYQQATSVIMDEPYSVEQTVRTVDASAQAETGVQGKAFASSAYQILLQSAIALRQLERARQLITHLEDVGGMKTRVTSYLVMFGRQLMADYHSFQDDSHRDEIRQSMAQLLADLVGREDGLTYGSLHWAASASVELAESATEQTETIKHFRLAALAYRQILDGHHGSPQSVFGIQVRLGKCLWRGGEYTQAIDVLAELLAQRPNIYDVQIEAAYALQLLGIDTDDAQSLNQAIHGLSRRVSSKSLLPSGENVRMRGSRAETDDLGPPSPQPSPASGRGSSLKTPSQEKGSLSVWGWSRIAATLQRQMSGKNAKPDYRDFFFETRYNIALCRCHAARLAQTSQEQQEQLRKAEIEITTLEKLYPQRDSRWWKHLDVARQFVQSARISP